MPWKALPRMLAWRMGRLWTVREGEPASVFLLSLLLPASLQTASEGCTPPLTPQRWPLSCPPPCPSCPVWSPRFSSLQRLLVAPFQEACLPARQQQISVLKRQSAFIQANKLSTKPPPPHAWLPKISRKGGFTSISTSGLPPNIIQAFHRLWQMAHLENPLSRIRSSTFIFIYFSFS